MSNKSPDKHNYKMPLPYRGQIVLWYQNGVRNEETSCPALVKVNSHSSLHLKVFAIDSEIDFTCVRHMDDPSVKEYDRIENGLWDFANRPAEAVVAKPFKDPLRGETDFEPSLEDSTAL